jgi:hypothetical protein
MPEKEGLMPRGGSKKGEHRGNAKRKDTPNDIMKAAVAAKPRKPGKRGRPPGLSTAPAAIERDIFISQVIHGIRDARDMSAKEIMLDNMADAQNAAYEYEAMAKFMAGQPDSEATRRAIVAYQTEARTNRRIASDEAYKVAPYLHSRRSAIALVSDLGQGDDIVQMMFDEIDRRNREHPMVIEHVPQKKTA